MDDHFLLLQIISRHLIFHNLKFAKIAQTPLLSEREGSLMAHSRNEAEMKHVFYRNEIQNIQNQDQHLICEVFSCPSHSPGVFSSIG